MPDIRVIMKVYGCNAESGHFSFMDLCILLKALKKTVNYGRIYMKHYVQYMLRTLSATSKLSCLRDVTHTYFPHVPSYTDSQH